MTFHCEFGYTSVQFIGDVYQCRASVYSSENAEFLGGIVGTHLDGKYNSDVNHLFLQNENLNYIPKLIDNYFPTLEGISWYNSNLLALRAEDLKQFEHLVFLGMWMNKITILESDVFKYVPNLKLIDFDSNLLIHVECVLGDLRDLQVADFSDNPGIDEYADTPEAIRDLRRKLCQSSTDPTVDTTTDSTTPADRVPLLPCGSVCGVSGRMPHRTCQFFFECIFGILHLVACPDPQIFDILTLQCGDPETSVCMNCPTIS